MVGPELQNKDNGKRRFRLDGEKKRNKLCLEKEER